MMLPTSSEVPHGEGEGGEEIEQKEIGEDVAAIQNSEVLPHPEAGGVEVEEEMEEIIEVDGEEIIFADEDEYVEYDAIVSLSNERNLLFDMYQPQITEQGTFLCKICLRTGKNTEYPDRNTFVAHRYKCHGSFNNNVICPITDCREVYASLYTLRRHLSQNHELPIEVHLQTFTNIGEFEKFRHLVELASGCRYMMHTKQPKYRRQVMHCAKSEHKLVLQTQKPVPSRHRLPRERMLKEGSACPSVISYRVNASNGEVHAFMQLYHVGHAPDSDVENSNADTARPMDIIFPLKPSFLADHPMQYVQIDVHEMPTAVYGSKIYEYFLIVTCLKSKFIWAKPLFDCTRTHIGMILNSIFNEYGIPEGFSTTFHPTYIRDAMKSLESVYAIEIREVWNEPIPYIHLERWALDVAEHDMQTRNRWVEQLQFVVMEYNQRSIREQPETPFERMFNRKAPNLYHNGQREDHLAQKLRGYHIELRREIEGMEEDLGVTFAPGQKVFLRKGITKPRRGNNTQFYFGYISDYDPHNQYYPYKVHYSSTDSPWPSERNLYAWVSVFDLLPTIHGISEMSANEKRESIASYLCSCPGIASNKLFDMSAVGKPARKASHCLLFRNLLCTNMMSKYCCKHVASEPCKFHSMYPENEESYTKMDQVLQNYLQTKELEKHTNKMQDAEPIRRMVQEEIDRMHMDGEDFDILDEDDYGPPVLERGDSGEVEQPEEVVEEVAEDVPEDAPEIEAAGTSEHVDIEGVEEPDEAQEDVGFQYEDVKPEAEEDDEPGTSSKRGRTSDATKSPEPRKRQKTSESSERRASGRRSVRPKNLEDYVVE
ncbi:hypothetical protein B9Z55_008449 [Caenorhabditis nigoni]|uniref:C2H2-type domain-containing protein n=1 Tax=Caenorhabditis nigoni TaxID=1611254 RepID=A0A2G5UNM7_9PELO|nr:hypothetical protein B9Z55_008449 [Caenorhabditis nigoni]